MRSELLSIIKELQETAKLSGKAEEDVVRAIKRHQSLIFSSLKGSGNKLVGLKPFAAPHPAKELHKKILNLDEPQLIEREKDLLRMKAISLAIGQNLTCSPKMIKAIRCGEIAVVKNGPSSTLRLSFTFENKVYRAEGAFTRESSKTQSAPILGSFTLLQDK